MVDPAVAARGAADLGTGSRSRARLRRAYAGEPRLGALSRPRSLRRVVRLPGDLRPRDDPRRSADRSLRQSDGRDAPGLPRRNLRCPRVSVGSLVMVARLFHRDFGGRSRDVSEDRARPRGPPVMPRPPALEVSRLSKRYRLGAEAHGVPAIGRWWRRRHATAADDSAFVWALKDVSFHVAEGERIGIIGRNGAGKSTLLKILSRVTHPTCGRAVIRGRIASLLEVGTGFNDDLSGRENVYLNAALHGLDRSEIDARYRDIVAFAELARFMEAPVKAYSSGMRMRLAFAVAAHLDPDILMLDEVLAVGDMSFQRKCLARMNELTSEGRTLLFVSHSMDAVTRFCDRCIWLESGQIRKDGPVEEVVTGYLRRVLG